MTASAILRCQFGDRNAIKQISRSNSAFWTGLVLVLITAIPRNYDQFHISEHTLKWVLGPLVFSTISGTWIWFTAYRCGTWPTIKKAGLKRTPLVNDWMSFMGLFWMTAPVAWLYAIPVERMFDSVTAARANLGLLGIVSAWRVALLSRALQVSCKWGYGRAFLNVLAAASAEAFAVTFMGGAFGKALMAGMGGMRNSPEETILLSGLMTVMNVSFFLCPATALIAAFANRAGSAQPLPEREKASTPVAVLTIACVAWLLIAIAPQRQLIHNARLDAMVEQGDYVGAVGLMSSTPQESFAPSRQLPPKAYERTVYKRLPKMIAATDAETETWVNEHLVRQLDVMLSHFDHHYRQTDVETLIEKLKPSQIKTGLIRSSSASSDWEGMLVALNTSDPGRHWLKNRESFLSMMLFAIEEAVREATEDPASAPAIASWTNVAQLLQHDLGVTTNLANEASQETTTDTE